MNYCIFENVRLGPAYPKNAAKTRFVPIFACVFDVLRFSLEAALAADDGLKRPRVGELGLIYP